MAILLLSRSFQFVRSFVRDPLAHWPFIPLSRQLTGNTAGAKQNFYGGLQLMRYRLFGRRDESVEGDADTSAAVAGLKNTGVLKIDEPLLPPDLIATIRSKFDKLSKSSGKAQINEYIFAFNDQDVVENVPEVFEIFNNPKLCALIQEFYSSAFHIDQIVYRRTLSVPENVANKGEIYSDYWHCDSSPVSELALFINLVDIDERAGPTCVIEKQTTRSLIRRYYGERRSAETINALKAAIEKNDCIQRFTGKAGSMLFAQTTKCLHRASIPDQGKSRDWLSFRFSPRNAPMVVDQITRNPILRYTHGLSIQ